MQYRLFTFLAWLFSFLPWTFLRRLAAFMGFCIWHFFPERRDQAVTAIEKHLEKTHSEARILARQSFTENCLSFLEIFHSSKFYMADAVSKSYPDDASNMMHKITAPVVIATAHIGSWEMMPGLGADIFPGRESMVVVRSQKNHALNRVVANLRSIRGMVAVDHRNASAAVLPKLRAGGVAAFLVDHNASRQEAVFLPFLNDIAAVNIGPASMALRAKAVVYPVFLIRDGKGKYILYTKEPLYTEMLEGTIKERIRAIAEYYTKAVEDVVRTYPEQWFWMHKRWKTREFEDVD